ncbi:MAG: hypothetical protein J0665_05510 [Deltaproteobacteria bacterium]|jgi:hypothetical protein|nr:hypothetical protein [Deltaproteobacteria bacterium]
MDNNPRLFTLIRNIDPSGISGTGRVLDGVIFHTGQVVTCWRTDVNLKGKYFEGYSTLGIYPSFDAFMHVHVKPHPAGASEVVFLNGETNDI